MILHFSLVIACAPMCAVFTYLIVMTDLRKSMTPRHLELLMFLRMNRRLWNEKTVEQATLAANV